MKRIEIDKNQLRNQLDNQLRNQLYGRFWWRLWERHSQPMYVFLVRLTEQLRLEQENDPQISKNR